MYEIVSRTGSRGGCVLLASRATLLQRASPRDFLTRRILVLMQLCCGQWCVLRTPCPFTSPRSAARASGRGTRCRIRQRVARAVSSSENREGDRPSSTSTSARTFFCAVLYEPASRPRQDLDVPAFPSDIVTPAVLRPCRRAPMRNAPRISVRIHSPERSLISFGTRRARGEVAPHLGVCRPRNDETARPVCISRYVVHGSRSSPPRAPPRALSLSASATVPRPEVAVRISGVAS